MENDTGVHWLIALDESTPGEEEVFSASLYYASEQGEDESTDHLLGLLADLEEAHGYFDTLMLVAVSEDEKPLTDTKRRIQMWLELYGKIGYRALASAITTNSTVDQVIVSLAAAAHVERTINFHGIGPVQRGDLWGCAFIFHRSAQLFAVAQSLMWSVLGEIQDSTHPLSERVASMSTWSLQTDEIFCGVGIGVLFEGPPVCYFIMDDTAAEAYSIEQMCKAGSRLLLHLLVIEGRAFRIKISRLGGEGQERVQDFIVSGSDYGLGEDATESIRTWLTALENSDDVQLLFWTVSDYDSEEDPFYSVAIPKERVVVDSAATSHGLMPEIADTEKRLREMIMTTLRNALGESWYSAGVPAGVQRTVEERLEREISSLPYREVTPEDRLGFADIGHLKDIIVCRENWPLFSARFGNKKNLERHFEDFIALRNVLAHHRELDPVIGHKGLGAIAWLRRCLALNVSEG